MGLGFFTICNWMKYKQIVGRDGPLGTFEVSTEEMLIAYSAMVPVRTEDVSALLAGKISKNLISVIALPLYHHKSNEMICAL